MKNIYYMIWADAILTAQKKNKFSEEWKLLVYLFAVFQALNLAVVIIFFKALFDIRSSITFQMDIFPGKMLDSLLPALIFYLLPFFLANYFLIVYKNRYRKIITKYKSYNGRLVLGYIVFSALLFFIPMIIMLLL